ncbi:MAG: alpha/beta hydrolase [Promethearchaeota archaeon]|nr:MAG: alpha/beta hydrolase [Candidatus Lokiarchaeota archaeon]
MHNFLKKIYQKFRIENVSKILLLLNSMSIIFGIVYLLSIIVGIVYVLIIWDIFGIILIIALLGNLVLVYLNSINLNKTTELGNRLNLLCYIYLIFIIFAMIWVMQGNSAYSSTYSYLLIDIMDSYIWITIGYFGAFIFGTVIAYIDFKNRDNRELWSREIKGDLKPSDKTIKIKKKLKKMLRIICYFSLAVGVFFAYIVITDPITYRFIWWMAMFIPQYGVFYAVIFLSTAILILKTKSKKKHPRQYFAVAIIGMTITGIFMAPLMTTPYSVYSAELNFADAFGGNWRDDIPDNVESKYFMKTPFSLPGYFLGMPAKYCNIEEHKKFWDKDDIELYFDAYWPMENVKSLPGRKDGNYSVIIKIHGGAWRYGDKGGREVLINKYFAAQGYAVFDIQYGLHYEKRELLPTPENVKGDFDIDDMMEHIGAFCKYLSNHTDKYKVNLDSVFITGGSAGGHLTMATGLAIYSGDYKEYFGDNIKIKGLIPLYPAHPSLDGKKEFKYPERYLLDEDAPPCLIYQGMQDYGCAKVSREIKAEYEEVDNDDCCILWFPLSGHANDIYDVGHFRQVFIYYMERFLYLCVHEDIE